MEKREIKFRCWNGEQMVSPDYIDRSGIAYWKENSIPTCDGNLMQYTGLKDKNGKEIYEGDILHSTSWGATSRTINPYHVVVWGECGWKAQGYNGTMKVNPDLNVKYDFEIIGNIYEHPHLLTP